MRPGRCEWPIADEDATRQEGRARLRQAGVFAVRRRYAWSAIDAAARFGLSATAQGPVIVDKLSGRGLQLLPPFRRDRAISRDNLPIRRYNPTFRGGMAPGVDTGRGPFALFRPADCPMSQKTWGGRFSAADRPSGRAIHRIDQLRPAPLRPRHQGQPGPRPNARGRWTSQQARGGEDLLVARRDQVGHRTGSDGIQHRRWKTSTRISKPP